MKEGRGREVRRGERGETEERLSGHGEEKEEGGRKEERSKWGEGGIRDERGTWVLEMVM